MFLLCLIKGDVRFLFDGDRKMKKRWITYILENSNVRKEGQGTRRYYVGRTTDLERRLTEHKKDGRQNYKLVWFVEGNYEAKIKKFGATLFMFCTWEGVKVI